MGRGERATQAQSVSRNGNPPQEEGEIAFIDADNIDDHSSRAAAQEGQASFGAPDDDQAIRNLISVLRRRPGSRGLDDEVIEDQAITLYNGICDKIVDGMATDAEITRAAELFGENPNQLIERLTQ